MARNPSDPEDSDLFLQEVKDATPLEHDRVAPWKRRRPPRPLQHKQDGDAEHLRPEQYSEQEIETEDELLYYRPGVQKRVFQDLRRGRLEMELELDLHGLTANHARQTLELFFRDCQRRNLRCVRIIHGKGYGSEGHQPVLKQKLNLWLRQREDVLAFCSATRRDGGTGAAYVLLRSARKNRQR